jgi:hypothetical protein
MPHNNTKRDPVTVILPSDPPSLTPHAARALLHILVEAYEQQAEHEACPGASHRLERGDG